MKRILAVIFSVILIVMVFPAGVSAEETLKAPTVQHKLINHDKIALRWSKIEGADYYYVYRTDVDTGETVRYTKSFKGTSTQIDGLKAETDYIFKVAAVSEKDGQITVGKRSKGTKLTTPKEWYYSHTRSVDPDTNKIIYEYYKENYNKSVKRKLKRLTKKEIGLADDVFSYDGMVYFVTEFPRASVYSDLPSNECLGRITEDGTKRKILYDKFGEGEGLSYRYDIYEDHMYVYHSSYWADEDLENIHYSGEFVKLSLKTGEATTIFNPIDPSRSFYVYDGYIYYISNYAVPSGRGKGNVYRKDNVYLCRVKTDGTEQEIMYKHIGVSGEMYVHNDDIYFYDDYGQANVYKLSLKNGEVNPILEESTYINNFEIVNGYIFFTEYKEDYDQYYEVNPIAYYRIKTDGTGLTKSDKPFEWRY